MLGTFRGISGFKRAGLKRSQKTAAVQPRQVRSQSLYHWGMTSIPCPVRHKWSFPKIRDLQATMGLLKWSVYFWMNWGYPLLKKPPPAPGLQAKTYWKSLVKSWSFHWQSSRSTISQGSKTCPKRTMSLISSWSGVYHGLSSCPTHTPAKIDVARISSVVGK
jgi:hypothetical protein